MMFRVAFSLPLLANGQEVQGRGCEKKLTDICPTWKTDDTSDCMDCATAHLSELEPECTEALVRSKCGYTPGDTTLKKVLLPEDEFGASGGRCLDGSMAGYYYGAPSSGKSSLWVLFLQGGGACTTEADCTKRARSKLGSSSKWPATDDSSDAGAILLADSTVNPDFHDAHHVWVPYCTGDSHSGQVVEPTQEQWGLYFSGHLNLKNILRHIQATIPATAEMSRLLLTGASAGGIGTMTNCDATQTFLSESSSAAKVSCAPIGGWFVPGFTEDHEDPDAPPSTWADWSAGRVTPLPLEDPHAMWLPHVPSACAEAHGQESVRCGSMHVLYPYIEAPMFVIESMWDSYQINALGLPSSATGTSQGQEYIAYYGRAMRNSTNLVVEHPLQKTGDGLYLPSCWTHTGKLKYQSNAKLLGLTTLQAVGDWFFGRGSSHIFIDDCQMAAPGLPCNPACDSIQSVTLLV